MGMLAASLLAARMGGQGHCCVDPTFSARPGAASVGRPALRRSTVGLGGRLVGASVLAACSTILDGGGIDPADPHLPDQVESLELLRVLELRAGRTGLSLCGSGGGPARVPV